MSLCDMDNSMKDSSSISLMKKKHGTNWVNASINRSIAKNGLKNVLQYLTSIHTLEELFDFIQNNHFNNDVIYSISRSKLIQSYFSATKTDILKIVLNEVGVLKTRYGTMSWYNGHLCRSMGERALAEKLVEQNIPYFYEHRYPDSRLKSDFYIPTLDLYIEYTGMTKSNPACAYAAKYEAKASMCIEKGLNFYQSADITDIINMIQHELTTNNRAIVRDGKGM